MSFLGSMIGTVECLAKDTLLWLVQQASIETRFTVQHHNQIDERHKVLSNVELHVLLRLQWLFHHQVEKKLYKPGIDRSGA